MGSPEEDVVKGLGFRRGFVLRIQCLGFRGLGFGGLGSRFQGSGFRGLLLRVWS